MRVYWKWYSFASVREIRLEAVGRAICCAWYSTQGKSKETLSAHAHTHTRFENEWQVLLFIFCCFFPFSFVTARCALFRYWCEVLALFQPNSSPKWTKVYSGLIYLKARLQNSTMVGEVKKHYQNFRAIYSLHQRHTTVSGLVCIVWGNGNVPWVSSNLWQKL